MQGKKKKLQIKVDQKERNVTPRVSLMDPVVNLRWKSVLEEIFRFVSVGGDFV